MSVAPKNDDVEKGWQKSTVRSIRRVLTETPGDEWYSFFKKYDTDDNDLIPMERFKKFIHEDAVQLNLTTEEVDELLRNADTNGDNFIDFAEFAALMTQIKKMYLKRAEIFAARTVLPRRQQSVRARQLLRYNSCPPPMFLIFISLVEIGVFVYQRHECGWKMCFLDEIFVVKYDSPWEIWRYFTYMFFHASYDHLWGNVTMTLIVGSTLELAHRWRIALVYILGSASAGLFSEAVHSSNNNRMGGASGAFFAVLGAHLSNVALNWDEMEHPYKHTILVTLCVVLNPYWWLHCWRTPRHLAASQCGRGEMGGHFQEDCISTLRFDACIVHHINYNEIL
ncbi:rhomboid family domain-containing protein [Ditylenchus destructor]|nr:rhomboid family domain-containing protein [Ditylenchus destructor]